MSSLLIISSLFPPRQVAGVYRTLRFTRYLPSLGWKVHVLTVRPHCYEDGTSIDESLQRKVPTEVSVHATRAVYPMQWIGRFKRLVRGSKSSSTKPNETATSGASRTPSARLGRIQKLKDAITLPLMTPDRIVGWVPFAVRTGKRVIRQHDLETLYSSGPPWSNHLVALKLSLALRKPWAADFRDPWVGSDYRIQRREENWVGRKHRELEKRVVETADRIILNTERSKQDMQERYPDLNDSKFVVIPNGFDPADYSDFAASPTDHADKLVIAHAGSFYGRRTVAPLIEALGNACRSGRIPTERIQVQLIGALRKGRTLEQDQVHEAGLEGVVEVLPPIPHAECLARLAAADILLLVQTEAPMCVPGKVFEYIALGKPVFTLSGEGATADLVHNANLGPCVAHAEVREIEQALIELYQRFESGEKLATPSDTARLQYDGCRLTERLSCVLSGMN